MHKAKRTPRQISLLPSVSRPRSIIRQLRKFGTFSRQFQSFYRFRGEEKGEEYNFLVCDGSGEMPCVCQEEGSGKTSNRKRNRKKKKEMEETKREEKQKQKKKNTNAENTNSSSLNVPFVKKQARRRVRMRNLSFFFFFQRRHSWEASRETACQGNSIPRETGEYSFYINCVEMVLFVPDNTTRHRNPEECGSLLRQWENHEWTTTVQARQITSEKFLLVAWAVRNFSPLLSRTKKTIFVSFTAFSQRKLLHFEVCVCVCVCVRAPPPLPYNSTTTAEKQREKEREREEKETDRYRDPLMNAENVMWTLTSLCFSLKWCPPPPPPPVATWSGFVLQLEERHYFKLFVLCFLPRLACAVLGK